MGGGVHEKKTTLSFGRSQKPKVPPHISVKGRQGVSPRKERKRVMEKFHTLGWAFAGQSERRSEIEIVTDAIIDEWEAWWESLTEDERRKHDEECQAFDEEQRRLHRPTLQDLEAVRRCIVESRPVFRWQNAVERIKGDLRFDEWRAVGRTFDDGTAVVATVRDGYEYIAIGRLVCGHLCGIDLDTVDSVSLGQEPN